MLAADTNVVVRLLVADDLRQQRAVVERLTAVRDAGDVVFVSEVVLAETSWVLDAFYGFTRRQIADAMDALLTTDPFTFEAIDVARAAIEHYRRGPAELADYLILGRALRHGADKLLTFDKKLRKHPSCALP